MPVNLDAAKSVAETYPLSPAVRGYVGALTDEIEELRAIITDAIPFIGYQAHVPDILERAEKAVDCAKEGRD